MGFALLSQPGCQRHHVMAKGAVNTARVIFMRRTVLPIFAVPAAQACPVITFIAFMQGLVVMKLTKY